jgi:cytosine deaminase
MAWPTESGKDGEPRSDGRGALADERPSSRRVTIMPSRPGTPDLYALAAQLAGEAADRGTFAVGGVLADERGRVIARARNAVVAGGRLRDPTAHVERQLIDWFFAAGPRDVSPSALTIVSSLEPCMMCAGSILRSGFKSVALTDDDFAGVGLRRGLPTLSPSLRERARSSLGSAAVEGGRAFVGAVAEPFRRPASEADFEAARHAFETTCEAVRRRIAAGTGSGARAAADAAPSDVVEVALEPEAAARWIADGPSHRVQDLPIVAERLAGDRSVAALADDAGRLLYVAAGATSRSPIRTAVMECVRGFTRDRSRLERVMGCELAPSALTLVMMGEIAREEEAVIAFGAAGSFVESPLATGRPPFVQLVGASASYAGRLAELLASFPPFYRDFVGLRVGLAPAPSV